ncbi:sigma-E processing peptidase SpoIIGA [Desulfovirgula thermocuniculi]|uniref:sigma-E processing peptidase SpoIIGA n=1 Tax=Desulfovirgula thermocuniculi TaxID=348842 RepID=UPI00042A7C79|nr:sigma-E processing peptidase SpoIIGA [Desulfovirgula thermocuniculi]
MGGYVVYVDQVLAGNLLLNYLLLWVAGRLSRVRAPLYRLWLSSLLGSVYSLLLFVPGCQVFFLLPCKVLASVLMVLLAFAPLSLPRFFSCLALFYLSSFMLGGIWLGTIYFLYADSRSLSAAGLLGLVSRHYWTGLVLALAVFAGGGAALALWRHRWRSRACQVGLAVEVEGCRVELEGMVDTGNSLRDPLTGHPVVVVEREALWPLLPPPMRLLLEKEGREEGAALMLGLAGSSWARRFCLIPFRSLGTERGMLLGFRPDLVEVRHEGGRCQFREVVLGLYARPLGNCQALVPLDLLGN